MRWGTVESLQHERSDAGSPLDEAFVLQLSVCLEHGVRVDRDGSDDFLHSGQLVTGAEHPEAERVLHLLDDLEIRSDPGAALEPELDHVLIPYLSRLLDKVRPS